MCKLYWICGLFTSCAHVKCGLALLTVWLLGAVVHLPLYSSLAFSYFQSPNHALPTDIRLKLIPIPTNQSQSFQWRTPTAHLISGETEAQAPLDPSKDSGKRSQSLRLCGVSPTTFPFKFFSSFLNVWKQANTYTNRWGLWKCGKLSI